MKKVNKDKIEEEKQAIYEDLVQEQPVRQVEVPSDKREEEKGSTTISEAMEMSTDLTDLQEALRRLFPEKLGPNSVMVGRIAPEVFLPMLHLVSVNEIMKSDPTQAIDVNKTYTNNYVGLSIGLDGKGRIDTAELLGAAREEKRAEKMLGVGGI